MSLYKKGLAATTLPPLGSFANPYVARIDEGRVGASLINRASKHFYKRGITGKSEPAFQKRPRDVVGGVMDSATSFLMDVVHLLLLLGGAYMLVNAIFG